MPHSQRAVVLQVPRVPPRRTALFTAVLFAVLVSSALGAGSALAATRYAATSGSGSTCSQASPCTLSTGVSGAAAGDTVLLASGSYGNFAGASKTGMVTVGEQDGASASLSVAYSSAKFITLDGLTIGGGSIVGSSRDVTIKNSTFTSSLTIDGLTNANILLDHNSHDWNAKYSGGDNGKVRIFSPNSAFSGVTVQNSTFRNGDLDGIHAGAGFNSIGNTFSNLCDVGSNHTDNIQYEGGQGGRIAGNYVFAASGCATQGISSYDGGTKGITFEDNVVDIRRPWGIELYGDNGSIVRHNTLRWYASNACDFNIPCGQIDINRKPADAAGVNTQVYDNVVTSINASNGSTISRRDHNMVRSGAASGDFNGTPVFAGGANPTTWAGFALAAGSPGIGAASDGTNAGIRTDGTVPPADTDGDGVSDLVDACPTVAAPGTLDGCPVATDTTPPDTTITSGPAASTASTSASLVFSATESVTYECRLDGGAWSACTSPKGYSGLAVGAHTFDVRATDPAGNVDATPASRSWTVTATTDTTPPDTTITSGPATSTTSTTASFVFSATESATFECRLDGGSWGTCSSPKAYSAVAVGAHTFNVRATDAAGNVDASPASRGWTVTAAADTTPPDTSITSGPAGTTSATSASLAFTSTESGSTFQCRVDGGNWDSCSSPTGYSSLAVGGHTFDVRATDGSGNVDASPATRSWTVVAPAPDTTAPDTVITTGPSGSTTDTTASVSFTSTEDGSSFACRVDGGAWAPCASPEGFSSLAAGAHTIEVRATDAAGNADASPASRSWTILSVPDPDPTPPAGDTTSPDTSISSGPATITSSRSAAFAFAATETPAKLDCSLDGRSWRGCTGPKTYTGLDRGRHVFRVRSTDSAGNVDATPAEYRWSIVRRWSGTYSFETLSNGKSTDSVQADSLEGACALVPSSRDRLAVRLKGSSVSRGGKSLKIRGKVPELAVDGVNARVRVSIRSHGRWRLLVSRRVHVRFDGAFSVRAPKRSGQLKVTAVVRCS